MDHGVGVTGHVVEEGRVEDGPLDELDTRHPGEVVTAAGGEVVDGHHPADPGVGAQGPAQVGADEPGPPGHDHAQEALRVVWGPYRGHGKAGCGGGRAALAGRRLTATD